MALDKMDVSGRLVMPDEWKELGLGLLDASQVQWEHELPNRPGMHMQAASLLAGYGLENLFKRFRIKQMQARGERIIGTKGSLTKGLTGHDLVRLARDTGTDLASHEEFLLKRLSTTTLWGGRYVAPKQIGPSDMTVMIGGDNETIRILALKIERAYDAL